MINNTETKTILIIDDDRNNVDILALDLEDEGYDILIASDGSKGWDALQQNKDQIKTILLDRMMPNMNGIEFMNKIKADDSVKDIPVIMQTAAAEKSQVSEGVQAGVYYYLTKPYEKEVMLSIVTAAITDYANFSDLKKELKQFKQKLYLVKEAKFEAKDLEDVRFLSTFLSNFYPDPERVVFGISEMLLNAVEHGNLGITYEEKTKLMLEGKWAQEIENRLLTDENKKKSANVYFKKDNDQITLEITDEGKGFNWKDFLEISPERATHSHGRGIALSSTMSFDSIEYIAPGNKVICTVKT